jgi:sugar phosphate isomerase/epimerase
MTRRQLLALAGSAPAWMASTSSAFAAPDFTRMGGTPTAFSMRSRAGGGGRGGAGRGGAAPGAAAPPQAAPGPRFDIVEHCHNIGLGGVQIGGLQSTDPDYIKKLRAQVEGYNFHVIIDPRLPQPGGDLAAFDAQVKAIKEVGATAMHAAMTNRRYEDFASFEPWKQMFERNQKTIEAALPVLEKYKIPLGIENHKGWRSPEQAAWMKRVSSEYVGVCLDFGNNVSLCEDPMDTLNNLLPYVVFAHIKDMAVLEYDEGFLLSEVVMGEGFLDLKQMVQILRTKNPKMIFDLEMITRDPLKIPVYTTKYWGSFDDPSSPLPGRDLAKVLDRVRKSKKPLPSMAGLTPEQQLKAEDDNNNQCISYARQNLAM